MQDDRCPQLVIGTIPPTVFVSPSSCVGIGIGIGIGTAEFGEGETTNQNLDLWL